jgi:hypothetical protein
MNGLASFAVVIFPDFNLERYDAIKRLLMIHLGIPSQCVRTQTIIDASTYIYLNLLLQITPNHSKSLQITANNSENWRDF